MYSKTFPSIHLDTAETELRAITLTVLRPLAIRASRQGHEIHIGLLSAFYPSIILDAPHLSFNTTI